MTATPKARNAGHPVTALVHGTAFVGDNLTRVPDATILIHGDRIEAAGPSGAVALPQSALRIDLRNRYVIPGLIDAHVHFFQSGGLYTRPDTIDLRSVRPYTDELASIKEHLADIFARYIRAGITSVADVGGPFWNYEMREASRTAAIAPRVSVAGPLISSVEREILDPLGDPPIVKIDSKEAARELVRRQIAQKTDFVKLWWVVTPERPAAAFTPIARDAIEHAHELGARVIVHATELETARLAVLAGTDILAHSVFDTDVDDAFVDLVGSKGVIYCPTLLVLNGYASTFHGTPALTEYDLRLANPDVVSTLYQLRDVESALPAAQLLAIRARRSPEAPHAAMRNVKRLHDAGVKIAAGTDAGNIGTQHASSLYAESIAMVESGLSPEAVLRTATRGGAVLLGRERDLGTIAAGKLADLVVLNEDPTKTIRAIAATRAVVKGGALYDAAVLMQETAEEVVQRQVNAYNAHVPEVLAETFAPDARLTRDGAVLARSRAQIEEYYRKRFAANPEIHAAIRSRMIAGASITDWEDVSGLAGGGSLRARVVYRVENRQVVEADIATA